MSTLKLLRAKRSLLNARASLFALWSWFLFPPCKVHESARVRALQLSVGLLFPCFCQSLSLSLYLLLSPTSPHSPTPNTYLYKHPYISVSYMSVSSYKKEKKKIRTFSGFAKRRMLHLLRDPRSNVAFAFYDTRNIVRRQFPECNSKQIARIADKSLAKRKRMG